MAKKEYCNLCGEVLDDPHDPSKCETTERLKGRETIIKLQLSIKEWKNAWFELRDKIAHLFWHHPAIDNEQERAYHQANLQSLEQHRLNQNHCTNPFCKDCQ